MKTKIITAVVAVCGLALIPGAAAAGKPTDRQISYPISAVFENPELRDKLPTDVKFFFADQPAAVSRTIGPVKTSRHTGNGHGAPRSCQQAMASALISLAGAARDQGGNAVVNIQSNWADVPSSSRDSYRCAIGGFSVSVALKGDVAVVN